MKAKKRKKLFIALCISILLISLIPIPRLFDTLGGPFEYRALIYTVYRWNHPVLWADWWLDGHYAVMVGIQIEIFGRIVYDNVRYEMREEPLT